ncbi:hypothetical protein DAPPUDRAFT_300415 [Daphnia pulex]|uniref:BRCT domain-containing protein n=1 Tax=Daphnia pulex TaxID=6669 RepID=E9G4N9_DAPPU|nr:hypothetical protein DAPPUDRAFT_300415 [Daphnia pulex]|eukprot:EFX85333.1 hypothetical protein DAPPUDRAFT_300415 [Daphnia pulex]
MLTKLTKRMRVLKTPAPETEYLHPIYKNLFNLSSFSKEPTPELVSMATGDSQDDVQYVRTLSKQSTAKNVTTEENNNFSEEKNLQTIFENLTTTDETEMEEDVSVLLKFRPVDALFSDLTFQLVGSMDADRISWTTYLIESNGGRVLAKGAKYKVTTPVVHAELLPDDPVGQAVVINTFWIEDCIDEDCLVEIEIYHQPIKFQNSQIFAGCVVSFSGIQGRLRDFLQYLVDHLGGDRQEFFFLKMEAKDVYNPTHLVCPKAEGREYEKAVKWGVPVVNAEWIIASATSSTRLKETDYPPEADEPTYSKDFTVPTPLTVVGICRPPGDPAETLSAPISFPSISFDAPTPVQIGQPTIPVILPVLTDSASEGFLLQTSHGTKSFGISPTPRPAISNMPTPETPYGRLLNPDPSPNTRKLWKHALDNRVRLTPRTEDSPTTTTPIKNERETLDSLAEDYFENLPEKMLNCNWEATDEVTNAEASPLPDPNLPPLHAARIFIGQEIEEDKRLEMEEFITTLGGQVILQHSQEVTHFICQGELTASEDMQNAKKWNQLFVLPQWIQDCEFAGCRLRAATCYQPSLNFETALLPDVAPVSSASQLENVPVRLASPPCSPDAVSRISQRPNASKRLNESKRLNASRYSGHSFRIMFSGMSQEDRDSCVQTIEVLGGIAIDGKHYDSTCTHLVVAKLECNDKLMTSIAAGKWIVHPGWIAKSEQTYHFVDERIFEWGNPASNDSISKEEARIAAAAYYWRTIRNRGLSTGPFQGIKATLYLRKKNDVFQQLIEAGGGEVIAPELALENGKTNLCVLDSREINKIKLRLYASKGIYCVPLNYLRDLILAKDKKCQWAECVLPEFLPFLDTIPSTHI